MDNDDEDDITPIKTVSGGYPLLQSMGNTLADQLDNVHTFDALRIRRQLRAITSIMASWGFQYQPSAEERKVLIDELVQAIKEASSMVGK